MHNHLKNELHNILSGKSEVRFGTIIQTIAGYLSQSAQTSQITQNQEYHDKQEKEKLAYFISA